VVTEGTTGLGKQAHFAIVPEDLIFDTRVSVYARLLWAALDRYADKDDRCYPGRTTLSRRLGFSESTLDKASAELVDVGWVQVRSRWERPNGTICFDQDEARRLKHRRTSNEYRLVQFRGTQAPSRVAGDPSRDAGSPPPATYAGTKATLKKRRSAEADAQDRMALRGRHKPWTPPADAVWSDEADGWVLPDGTKVSQ
jgi:hypothetical protein